MKPLPSEIIEFQNRYREAHDELIESIRDEKDKKKLLLIIAAILTPLWLYSNSWVNKYIPIGYKDGINSAYKTLKGVKSIPDDNLDIIMTQTAEKLNEASTYMGTRVLDDFNKLLKVKDVKLAKKGLFLKGKITDKRGFPLNVDAYATMVVRTAQTVAHNYGVIQQITDAGQDLVKVSTHMTTCPICIVYEGRVYSISGNDKRYPKLSEAFNSGYSTLHPNCRHFLLPYIREFDKNADELQEKSNLPFKIQENQKASVSAYEKDQARKAKLRVDIKAWDKSKVTDPNTPKTLSGFKKSRA